MLDQRQLTMEKFEEDFVCNYKREPALAKVELYFEEDAVIKVENVKDEYNVDVDDVKEEVKDACRGCGDYLWYEQPPGNKPSLEDIIINSPSISFVSTQYGPNDGTNGNIESLSCNFCSFSCYSEDELLQHEESHTLKCSYCTYTTISKTDLANHEKSHISQADLKSPKSTSGHNSTLASGLEFHRKSDYEIAYTCPHCDLSFTTKSDRSIHCKIAHKDKKLKCSLCPFSTADFSILDEHQKDHSSRLKYIKNICGGPASSYKGDDSVQLDVSGAYEKVFPCLECSFVGDSALNLRKHLVTHFNEKPLKCGKCSFSCRLRSTLDNHEKTHSVRKPFKCPFCPYSAAFVSRLRIHARKHSVTGATQYPCQKCSFIGQNITTLRKHQLERGHRYSNEKPYKCPDCPYSSYTFQHLTRHRRKHCEEKEFKCEVCIFSSTTKSGVGRHRRTHSEKSTTATTKTKTTATPKILKCPNCAYTTSTRSILEQHYLNNHSSDKLLKCEDCSFSCYKPDWFQKHRNKHLGIKPYKCPFCPHTAENKTCLRLHLRTHSGEKPFKCSYCDYACTQKHAIITHERAKHTGERPFKCSDCSYAAVSKQQLNLHRRNRHDIREKYDKEFPCTECDFVAHAKSSLRNHHKHKHSNVRPWQCTECDYGAVIRHDLIKHQRIHTGEKPFKCSECSYTAAQSSSLTQHRKRKHPWLFEES